MSDQKVSINGLLSASEVVLGLILTGKVSSMNFSPEKFSPKYGAALKDIKAGKTKEELYVKYQNLLQPCEFAAKSVGSYADTMDWGMVIDKAYSQDLIATDLGKAQRLIEAGDMEKFDELMRRISATRNSSQRLRSVTADEIADDYVPFMNLGATAWDTHIGGIPTMGMIILGAKTFTGKTTVAISAMEAFLKEYPEREILFVTLEDMAEGWKERARMILGDRAPEFWKRIHVMEFARDVEEIISEAGRFENVGMVLIDYIDLLVKTKDLASYDQIYQAVSQGSKSLAVASKFRSMPIFLLAQFGKGNYQGGVPTQSAILYTGEQYAYQICMLYHADGDFYTDKGDNGYELPIEKGTGYLVFWKVKNGCRPHAAEFPGAIKVPWTPRYGFNLNSDDSTWFALTSETKKIIKKK
jgi:hypothetical protein